MDGGAQVSMFDLGSEGWIQMLAELGQGGRRPFAEAAAGAAAGGAAGLEGGGGAGHTEL
jgi:hypothetical protein